MRFRLWVLLCPALIVGLAAGGVYAGGMIMYEVNSPSTGTASAGWAALAGDASTAFANPAGMTRLDRSQLLVGAQPVISTAEFNSGQGTRVLGGGNTSPNGGEALPSLGGYYVHSLSDRFKLGVSSLSYFGAGLDYGDDWVGRYRVKNTMLLTSSLLPSAAYRLNDWLSVGVMLNVTLGYLKSETAINNILNGMPDGQMKYKDTTFGYGGGAGILVEPNKGTRIGVTYYSPVNLDFSDTPSVDGAGPILSRILKRLSAGGLDLNLTIPQWVMFSVYQQVNDNFALMANFGWQNWSQFAKVDIALEAGVDSRRLTMPIQMDDTWHAAIGAQLRLARPWLLSVGFAYDTSPMSLSDRSPSLPLDRTFRYAAGLQYEWNSNITLGLAYEFIDLGSANINKQGGPFIGSLVGDYGRYNANVVNVNLSYKF